MVFGETKKKFCLIPWRNYNPSQLVSTLLESQPIVLYGTDTLTTRIRAHGGPRLNIVEVAEYLSRSVFSDFADNLKKCFSLLKISKYHNNYKYLKISVRDCKLLRRMDFVSQVGKYTQMVRK